MLKKLNQLSASFLVLLAANAIPVRGDVINSNGTVEARAEIRTGTEQCGREASPACPIGQPCFVVLDLEGQAARALYEAMKRHGTKTDDFSGNQYVSTQTDALSCYEEDGKYSCRIGYDAVANVLTGVDISDCE